MAKGGHMGPLLRQRSDATKMLCFFWCGAVVCLSTERERDGKKKEFF